MSVEHELALPSKSHNQTSPAKYDTERIIKAIKLKASGDRYLKKGKENKADR